MYIYVGILVVGSLLGFLFFMVYYNKLSRIRGQISEAFAGIEVQQQRRKELLPELAQLFSAYSPQMGESVGELVTEYPSAMPGATYPEHAEAAEPFENALDELMRGAKGQAQLGRDPHFIRLSEKLDEIEEKEQLAKRYFNALVRDYNQMVEGFPSVVAASLLGFKKESFYGQKPLTQP